MTGIPCSFGQHGFAAPVRCNWGKMKGTTIWEQATRLYVADARLNENSLYQKPNHHGDEHFASRPYGTY